MKQKSYTADIFLMDSGDLCCRILIKKPRKYIFDNNAGGEFAIKIIFESEFSDIPSAKRGLIKATLEARLSG